MVTEAFSINEVYHTRHASPTPQGFLFKNRRRVCASVQGFCECLQVSHTCCLLVPYTSIGMVGGQVAGMNVRLIGEANDYVGKGMAGGDITIVPPPGQNIDVSMHCCRCLPCVCAEPVTPTSSLPLLLQAESLLWSVESVHNFLLPT